MFIFRSGGKFVEYDVKEREVAGGMAEKHNRSGGPLLRHTIDSLITERATRYFQHIMDFGVDRPLDPATRPAGEVAPLVARG